MGPDSLVLALKTTFQPEKAEGLEARYELRLGSVPFKISVKEGEFQAARGEAESPDAVIEQRPRRRRVGGLRRKTGWGRRWQAGDHSDRRQPPGCQRPLPRAVLINWRIPHAGHCRC